MEGPVSARRALAVRLERLQTELRWQAKTQKAAVAEANRRRRIAAGRSGEAPWPRREGGVDLSPQAVNDWFPKRKGSKETSVPQDFEDLWSVVAVMLEWTGQITDRASADRFRRDWNTVHKEAQRGTRLDEQVRGYLEAARKAAEQHPHPGLPGEIPPSLAKVYVRQLSTPVAREGLDASRRGTPTAVVEPAEVVFRTAERVCVLIASPGGGKSTLLRTRLRDAAGDWLGATENTPKIGAAVPVWVSARILAAEETSVPDALAAATRTLSRYGRHPGLDKSRFLQRPCTVAHWQLLVDGLDELPNAAQRRAVLEKLANAVAGDPLLYRCVVATRPLTENELDVLDSVLGRQVPRYDLQPFTADDLHIYTKLYFGTRWPQEEAARRAHQFTGALRSAFLAELARTPLMAFTLCQLYLADPDRPLPRGRTAVYEAFTDLVYENNQSKHVADSHEEAINHLVQSLQSPRARQEADEAARKVHEQLPELIDYLAHQWLTGHQAPAAATLASHKSLHRPSRVHPELWEAFLEDLLRHTGLLLHRADGLSFPHRTFLEYHAARHATRNQQTRRQTLHQLFGAAQSAPGWQNQEPSYLGFLIDGLLTPHDDPISEATKAHLKGLTASAGQREYDFLVQQTLLRTNLPYRSTIQQLARFATDRVLDDYDRIGAARVLAEVDVERGTRLLESFAADPTLGPSERVYAARGLTEVRAQVDGHRLRSVATRYTTVPDRYRAMVAAQELVEVGVVRGTRLLTPATDPSLRTPDLLHAAWELVKVDAERGARLLETLATDTTFTTGKRLDVARELVKVDAERGTRLLETLATDTAFNTFGRLQAARALAQADRTRNLGAQLLQSFATDRTLNTADRVWAARELVNVDAEQGTGLLEHLATDPALIAYDRVWAAWGLAEVDAEQGIRLLEHLATDPALIASHRVLAARGLADVDRKRGTRLLESFASDPTLDTSGRVQAARALAELRRRMEDG